MSTLTNCEGSPTDRSISADSRPLVQMRDIVKTFGGIKALQGVDLEIYPGEVHVILGENGAGKSTMMKILSGIYAMEGGVISLDGVDYTSISPTQAAAAGISIIYQELSVIDELSVLENLFVGRIPEVRRLGVKVVDWATMREDAKKILGRLGLDVDLSTPVGSLPIAHKQMVEIAKSLMRNARVLVMDEPTSSLTNVEVDRLFDLVAQLRSEGTALVFISHKLDEVRRIGDRYTVLKDGKSNGTGMIAQATNDDLVRLMVGRSVKSFFHNEHDVDRSGTPVLKVVNMVSGDRKLVRGVDFEVFAGEIIGFAGLVGSGRTDLMNCLFGAVPRASGKIELRGKDITPSNPTQAIKNGIAYITESRRQNGFIANFSIRDNIVISQSVKTAAARGMWGLIRSKDDETIAAAQRKALNVKCASVEQNITELSGGNQQKVLIGKWMCTNPEVFIFDEPTRGIDVGSKSEIYAIMRRLADEGKAIIMVSSELPEILAVCDRIAVFNTGRIATILDGKGATEEQILKYAIEGEE